MRSIPGRWLLCGVASFGFAGAPAFAQDTQPAGTQPAPGQPAPAPSTVQTGGLGDIIVTARRKSENLQSVPVAVSVVSQAEIETKGTFSPVNLAESTPGLSVNASVSDRNNLTYSIRGQGFAFETLFPAVITYYAEVPVTQLTTGQFFDLQDVQVLRGPQGVEFGRVTDGGNVMVNPKRPTNDFGGYVQAKLGNYNLHTFTGALNLPLVSDKVLVRGAFEIGRRDGFTKDIATGKDLDNIDYESYRLGIILRPTDSIENYTSVSYQHTHDNGTGTVFTNLRSSAVLSGTAGLFAGFGGLYGIDRVGNVGFTGGVPNAQYSTPLTPANYLASLQSQLAQQQALGPRKVAYNSPNYDRRDNLFIANQTTFHVTDEIDIKNIFGYVNVKDDEASNYAASNGQYVLTCHGACGTGLPFNSQEQFSDELRVSGKMLDNKLSWSLGGYMDKQDPAGREFENDTINLGILRRTNVQYSTTKSKAVYGSAEYEIIDHLKVTGGLRYTHDTVSSITNTYLAPNGFPPSPAVPAIPHGQCQDYNGPLGPSPCLSFNEHFNATTWMAGLSYEFGPRQLVYAKVSRGYRPGGVNGSGTGSDVDYKPEFDRSIEVGIKSDWQLGGDVALRTNLALYTDNYTSIQKLVQENVGGVPVAIIRNIGGAHVKGVEFEGTLVPIHGLTLGATFDYTDAKYKKPSGYNPAADAACDPTAAAITNLNSPVGFCFANPFSYTPKFQYSFTANYAFELPNDRGTVAVGGRYYHQSREALTDFSRLEPEAVEPGYGLLDLDLTWKKAFGKPLDFSVFVNNVANKLYRIGVNGSLAQSSIGIAASIYAPPRMWGVSARWSFGGEAR
ncbi:MAG: TonB-dependent receptor [Alphaproteobacteria bacterium]|nr:TonB-dependent receptor [Alphaproteobacteria bacterium]